MSDNKPPLKVVLCWHMHQPYYANPATGDYQLPWAYLHAIKDYSDMAWYLETIPGARAVVNFTPTLLEQLDDYGNNIRHFLKNGGARLFSRQVRLHDPLLTALVQDKVEDVNERKTIIHACLRANQKRLIDRYPVYRKLVEVARSLIKNPELLPHIEDQYFSDLSCWYHIAWVGETIKLENSFMKGLIAQTTPFQTKQRLDLLRLIGDIIANIVPRFKALAKSKKVELSVTPYAHPIAPLLLDINSAREAWHDIRLPTQTVYPGGEERVRWHIHQGLDVFKKHFGFIPVGCWPAEGSLSDATLNILAAEGFQWTATGENVLKNSVRLDANRDVGKEYCVHQRFDFQGKISCFFRDDGLSDEIGFTYSDWHGDDAAANLMQHLKNIRNAQPDLNNAVVAIILDGENAWEYYPNNGYYFLSALYKQLATNKHFELTTFGDCIHTGIKASRLHALVAGSWVFGTFSTWIGQADKNRAWDLLTEAKAVVDKKLLEVTLSESDKNAILRQLAICEGSDWFWWFGDDNPGHSVSDFDMLYRLQLEHLYQLLKVPVPDGVKQPLSRGGRDAAAGGVMRPGNVQKMT